MFVIRKLRSFAVNQHILGIADRSPVESILSFNITAWYGNLSRQGENKLSRIVNVARKVIGKSQRQLCNIFDSSVRQEGNTH